jgi:xylose dehydrogenase (NAD/NADP)
MPIGPQTPASDPVRWGILSTARINDLSLAGAREAANVRLLTELDGGALMDVGCYCVSGSRLIAGEPERVAAEQALGGDGVDVAFAATMRFAGDVLAHFDAGIALASRDELEVVGEHGSLFLDDPWHCRTTVIELRREDGVQRIEALYEAAETGRTIAL